MAKGFIAENWKLRVMKHPVEDAYSIDRDNGIIAVADGVTRDPMVYLPNMGSLRGKLGFLWNYPKQSPARKSSEIFVETFPLVLRDYAETNRDEKAVRNAFEEVNNRIKDWNQQHIPNPDYVMNDFAGCVAAGTSRSYGNISFGFLTDSGVAIFDANGELRFRTENQGPDKHDKYIWQDERLQDIEWRNPEARRIIRRDYRNNPSEEHSFGVLTGQPEALHYVRTGTQELRPGDSLIVYTDGLEHTIFSGEFSELIRKGDVESIEKLCKRNVRTEGTLVYDYRETDQELLDRVRSEAIQRERDEIVALDGIRYG